jgi:hypothetical protein
MTVLNDLLPKQRLTQIDVGQSQLDMPDRIAKTIKEQSAKYRLSKSKIGKRWCKVYPSIQRASKESLTMNSNGGQPFEFQLK